MGFTYKPLPSVSSSTDPVFSPHRLFFRSVLLPTASMNLETLLKVCEILCPPDRASMRIKSRAVYSPPRSRIFCLTSTAYLSRAQMMDRLPKYGPSVNRESSDCIPLIMIGSFRGSLARLQPPRFPVGILWINSRNSTYLFRRVITQQQLPCPQKFILVPLRNPLCQYPITPS